MTKYTIDSFPQLKEQIRKIDRINRAAKILEKLNLSEQTERGIVIHTEGLKTVDEKFNYLVNDALLVCLEAYFKEKELKNEIKKGA
jgi:hypothetical protein